MREVSDLTMKTIKRMAAEILKVGESRIWIDPEKADELYDIVSREQVKKLIHDGVIKKLPPSTPSRGRIRMKKEKKKKGRRRGHGKRKGPRYDEKDVWISKIRAQRKFLKNLRERKLIDKKTYRRLYRLSKGGFFRSIAHLKLYIREHKLIRKRRL